MSRVILLEANEHTPRFLEEFLDKGIMPNLAKLRSQSDMYTTYTDEKGPSLNPWVQWVTIHTGVEQSEHGIKSLGEGSVYSGERIWDCVSNAGEKSIVCSSMNVNYSSSFQGCIFPDPWDSKTPPSPKELMPFMRFVQRAIQGHIAGTTYQAKDVINFVLFMFRHGVSLKSIIDIVKQLAGERFDKTIKWKRVTILDQLLFDVFKHYHKKEQPKFATFFTNSVAHLQHRYWRHCDPEVFKVKPSAEDLKAFSSAVEYGYRSFDILLGNIMKLAADNDTAIVYCTALSQQPCLDFEDIGGKNVYRPKSFESVIKLLGVSQDVEVTPVMSQQANLYFNSEAEADAAEAQLQKARFSDDSVKNTQAFMVARKDSQRIMLTFSQMHKIPGTATVSIEDGASLRFYEHFLKLGTEKSGSHNPEGICWIWEPNGSKKVNEERIPLTSIAPTILHRMGIPAASQMKGPLLGV